MLKIIGVTDLQRGFRKVFDEVAEGRTPYVVTRGSRPEAVLLSYDEYQQLASFQEKEIVHEFDRLLARQASTSASIDEAEVQEDVESARREVRHPETTT